MGRILYLDCYSGASGDMLIGALLDAGLPFDTLRAALGSLALEDECRVSAERVSRSGIGATKFTVTETTGEVGGTHRHRHLPGITKLVDQSALSDSSKQRANRLFRRLAETEATIHQMPVEKVHLHEVGALDSIIDIVGGVFALEWFGADRVVASPINVGSGTVTCEHGTLPVPAPATASLVSGVPVYAAGPPGEMLTPTGALLVTEFAGEYGPLPPMRIEKIGYGAGTRDPAGHPNVLRVLAGEATGTGGVERLAVVECEIDDMNPQIFGVLMDRLYAAGAVDVFYTPVQMKKNRPGTHVTVLVPRERREAVSATLFRESTTIGVRHMDVTRETLRRELVPVSTRFGEVRCKVAWREAVVVNVAPEFDDCARLAEQHGVPVKEVHADAAKAYQDIGGTGRSPV
ncbi:MAG: TIGR00299 family protein [Acidobacteria bacterium]|nr:TIGR00299 family protein [Acidobacteriota bacterium]MDP7479903.1 nickel pincer cofactor biosynthesis protein LarC [Vicinamibacterales bacterium]HJN45958.1 nickel pincer cofactor biosynthesis protein LarC [Vicinamibacterales bacterium]